MSCFRYMEYRLRSSYLSFHDIFLALWLLLIFSCPYLDLEMKLNSPSPCGGAMMPGYQGYQRPKLAALEARPCPNRAWSEYIWNRWYRSEMLVTTASRRQSSSSSSSSSSFFDLSKFLLSSQSSVPLRRSPRGDFRSLLFSSSPRMLLMENDDDFFGVGGVIWGCATATVDGGGGCCCRGES